MRISEEELCDLEEEMLADRAPSERMVLKAILDLRDLRAMCREYFRWQKKYQEQPWDDEDPEHVMMLNAEDAIRQHLEAK